MKIKNGELFLINLISNKEFRFYCIMLLSLGAYFVLCTIIYSKSLPGPEEMYDFAVSENVNKVLLYLNCCTLIGMALFVPLCLVFDWNCSRYYNYKVGLMAKILLIVAIVDALTTIIPYVGRNEWYDYLRRYTTLFLPYILSIVPIYDIRKKTALSTIRMPAEISVLILSIMLIFIVFGFCEYQILYYRYGPGSI